MSAPIAKAKCYLNAGRNGLVKEGSADARYLFANKGEEVPAGKLHGLEGVKAFFKVGQDEDPADESPAEIVQNPEEETVKHRRQRG